MAEIELNKEQRQAVEELEANILLLAPAGTGKTNTLACRIAHIIAENRALPEEILCLTFTNKACREMRERVEARAGDSGSRVMVKTFHGFCYEVIKTEAKRHSDLFTDFTIFDETDCQGLLKEIVAEEWPLRAVQNLVNQLKEKKADGYKSGDIIGKFGLEKIYDKYVRGEDGGDQVEVDVSGKPVKRLGRKMPVPGDDLVLTIDKDLQTAAEKAVDDRLAAIHASAAAAVVMNPQTGEVLAMVSRPAFDPNLFAHGISSKDWAKLNNNPFHPMDNKTISGEYPPGSTFKIVTGTAALTEGKVAPEEKIFDSGHHWIIPKGNAEGEALGWINFQEALAHSDNVYFYEMGNRLGIDLLEKYARMFGLGQRTGIDLPYEAKGLVANREYKKKNFEDGDWYLSETFDAAIGQGFNLVTPLQAAMVMGEIAADGKRYKPHLVSRIQTQDGDVIKEFQPELLSELQVPANVIRLVQEGLHDVTKFGTAASTFRGFPVDIAGKTGTAENSQGRDHGWFVAYGPFDNPNIVVAVIVEQGGFGSQSAVPIGREILEAAFHVGRYAPDAQQQDASAGK